MARTLPSEGLAPIDSYVCEKNRTAGYFEYAPSSADAAYGYSQAIKVVTTLAYQSGYTSGIMVTDAITAGTTIEALYGIWVYMTDIGSGSTVEERCGLHLGMYNTNAATAGSFIKFYTHGATAMPSMLWVGGGAGATHFCHFGSVLAPVADNGNGTTVLTGNCYKISMNIAGDTVYLVAVGTVTTS